MNFFLLAESLFFSSDDDIRHAMHQQYDGAPFDLKSASKSFHDVLSTGLTCITMCIALPIVALRAIQN
jgi:hypothetical protein